MPLISYDGTEIFANQIPPLVAKTSNFIADGGSRSAVEERISLKGLLTGCGLTELVAARNSAAGVFSANFKDLVVDGTTFGKVKIQNVSFDQSDYLNSISYSIDVLHYPTAGFEFADGVINPSNTYTYTENPDQTMTMRQSVSAKGVNTSASSPGNALDNAKTFVLAQVGDFPRPALISTEGASFEYYLTDSSANIDKINNTVSIDRTCRVDLLGIDDAVILRYTKETSQNEGEPITIRYGGTVDAGREGAMPRSKYSEFKDGIDATILDENVTEDPGINRISFSFSYIEDDNSPAVKDDFTITISEGADSSLFKMSINGTLSSKEGCIGKRFTKVKDAYKGDSHNFNLCQDIYNNFYTPANGSAQGNPGVSLNPAVMTSSVGYNKFSETVSYSASLDDRTTLGFDCHSFDYSMDCQPALQVVKPTPAANGKRWIFQDLGYKTRARFAISTSAKGCTTIDTHDFSWDMINEMVAGGTKTVVDIDTSTITNEGMASSNFGVSFLSASSATSPPNYTTISSLNL